MSRAKRINGVQHRNRCACPICDPEGAQLKAARQRFLAERRNPPPALAPPLASVPLTPAGERLRRAAGNVNRSPRDRDLWRAYHRAREAGLSREAALAAAESEITGGTDHG